ncbi:MAG: hypothetical protein AB1344_03980 [Pseudomonadota bacterium]
MTPQLPSETSSAEHCVHGVLIALRLPGQTLGVLLVGEPGIGKSELALELISRGHALIADDAPCFRAGPDDRLIGCCPSSLRDFLEVRGLGIINVHRLFGAAAVNDTHPLDLVIRLLAPDALTLDETMRLEGAWDEEPIAGRSLPRLSLSVQAGRPLALLVETAAQTFLLRRSGYNAAHDLSTRLESSTSPTDRILDWNDQQVRDQNAQHIDQEPS